MTRLKENIVKSKDRKKDRMPKTTSLILLDIGFLLIEIDSPYSVSLSITTPDV